MDHAYIGLVYGQCHKQSLADTVRDFFVGTVDFVESENHSGSESSPSLFSISKSK